MNILGLYGAFGFDPWEDPEQAYCHEAGASIVKDGVLVTSICEERLSKVKYDGRVPANSIQYCLKAGDLSPEEIDCVYIADCGMQGFYRFLNDTKKELKEFFINAKIEILNHHLCHASASVFTTDKNEGTFITLDGSGSIVFTENQMVGYESSSIGYFNKEKKKFRIFQSHPWSNNFGLYYITWAARIYMQKIEKQIWLCNPEYRDTYCGKIMGLAAYGKPKYDVNDFDVNDSTTPEVQMRSHPDDGKHHEVFDLLEADDRAYFLQDSFEKGLLTYLKLLKDKGYLEDNLCLSGGIFLNILANTKIVKEGIAKHIHIPPFPSDCGLHLGAALYGAYMNDEKIILPKNLATLGVEYTDEQIQDTLNEQGIKYKKYDSFSDLCDEISKDLRDNKIVGWFQNKSEHGPRALGSRSLFMNAQPKENKDVLNSKVKHREHWRPFAGIILENCVEEYFEEGFKSPYMLFSQTIKKEKINSIEAICHEDQTCRIQTVNKDLHPQVNSLLEAYLKLTDSPVILNTSFNDNGQPIVETPKDAIETFLNLQVDTLAIGNYVVKKINQ